MPHKGKVKLVVKIWGEQIVRYLERYGTLNIAPIFEYNDKRGYLTDMTINDGGVTPIPILYLGERIDTVELFYTVDVFDIFGGVVQQFFGVNLNNLMPQLITRGDLVSLPRGFIYKGVKLGDNKLDGKVVASPVNLDDVDFEIWQNGIKFTLRLNRNKTLTFDENEIALFDIIKAEFYGELLPAIYVDDYVELKPKGA